MRVVSLNLDPSGISTGTLECPPCVRSTQRRQRRLIQGTSIGGWWILSSMPNLPFLHPMGLRFRITQ